MSIIAILVGTLFGYLCFNKRVLSWLFLIFHTAAYSSKKRFYNLYDIVDDDVSFEWYTGQNDSIKKYADYLKLHAAARPSAYKTFKSTYDLLVWSLFTRTLPIAFAPAILFWSDWYFYLIGVAMVVTGLIGYEVTRNGLRPGFYLRLAIFSTLNT
jgi:hypothetical protein